MSAARVSKGSRRNASSVGAQTVNGPFPASTASRPVARIACAIRENRPSAASVLVIVAGNVMAGIL